MAWPSAAAPARLALPDRERRLPEGVLQAAADQDVVRQGYRGSAWFAHRAGDVVTRIEVHGPAFKGSLTGGPKTLFRFAREGEGCRRLVIAEAPIDALSIAAIEGEPPGTVCVATGGGIGPGTIAAIEEMLTACRKRCRALQTGHLAICESEVKLARA